MKLILIILTGVTIYTGMWFATPVCLFLLAADFYFYVADMEDKMRNDL